MLGLSKTATDAMRLRIHNTTCIHGAIEGSEGRIDRSSLCINFERTCLELVTENAFDLQPIIVISLSLVPVLPGARLFDLSLTGVEDGTG